ncbi:MAG: adenylate/guanylate cyclase domain-containing protein, partial [Spartobacteria bacterium]
MTAFFSDVAGFSGFSELLTPQQLVALMNEYLTAMTDILMEQGCYVDKYIGDAIVGIYNAPAPVENHALRACVASQLLRQRLADLRKKWVSEGDKWPSI